MTYSTKKDESFICELFYPRADNIHGSSLLGLGDLPRLKTSIKMSSPRVSQWCPWNNYNPSLTSFNLREKGTDSCNNNISDIERKYVTDDSFIRYTHKSKEELIY
jgi:hypothetical protein